MKKVFPFFLFFFVFSAFSLAITAQTNEPRSTQTKPGSKIKKKKNNVCGLGPSVSVLKLGHSQISNRCPPDSNSCSSNTMVEVRAIAAAVLDDEAYVYKVSAGKIVGTGPNVVWDLSGVKSGTYTITSGIDTGPPWGVVGLTRTRSVMVTDCVDCEEKP